jgi:hypothetical protein
MKTLLYVYSLISLFCAESSQELSKEFLGEYKKPHVSILNSELHAKWYETVENRDAILSLDVWARNARNRLASGLKPDKPTEILRVSRVICTSQITENQITAYFELIQKVNSLQKFEEVRSEINYAIDQINTRLQELQSAPKKNSGKFQVELATRANIDQFWRKAPALLGKEINISSEPAKTYISNYIYNKLCISDYQNAEWLKAKLEEVYWPKASVYGADASENSWLIVQHAGHDIPFMNNIYQRFKNLLRENEISLENYKLLESRLKSFGQIQ